MESKIETDASPRSWSRHLVEYAEKAERCAGLLVDDLRELNKASDPVVSMLVMGEISKAAEIANRLKYLAQSIKERDAIRSEPQAAKAKFKP